MQEADLFAEESEQHVRNYFELFIIFFDQVNDDEFVVGDGKKERNQRIIFSFRFISFHFFFNKTLDGEGYTAANTNNDFYDDFDDERSNEEEKTKRKNFLAQIFKFCFF